MGLSVLAFKMPRRRVWMQQAVVVRGGRCSRGAEVRALSQPPCRYVCARPWGIVISGRSVGSQRHSAHSSWGSRAGNEEHTEGILARLCGREETRSTPKIT